MTTILKKEWTISFWLILAVLLIFIPVSNFLGSPINLPFMGIFILLFHLFQTDEKSKMNVYLTSLPIEKKIIVRGRYIFFSLFVLTIVVFQFFTNKLIHTFPQIVRGQPFTLAQALLFLIIILILFSFWLPIYYRFTFNIATLIFITSLFLGGFGLFVLLFSNEGFLSDWLMEYILLEKYIPLALGLAILIFGLSYRVSVAIFERKEFYA